MELIESKIFYINSRDKLNTTDTDSNFSVSLDIPNNSNYNKACILDISIPKSYYLVQTGASFVLVEGVVSTTINVSPGNYNRKNFGETIVALLNIASPNLITYSISYTRAPDTGLYNFSLTGSPVAVVSFVFTDTLYELFGFAANSTNTFTGSGTSKTMSSSYVCKFALEDVLMLHCDNVSNGSDNILLDVYTNGSDFSVITKSVSNIFAYGKEISHTNNNVWKFLLTNEDGTEILLNGLNLNFTLMLFRQTGMTNILDGLSIVPK